MDAINTYICLNCAQHQISRKIDSKVIASPKVGSTFHNTQIHALWNTKNVLETYPIFPAAMRSADATATTPSRFRDFCPLCYHISSSFEGLWCHPFLWITSYLLIELLPIQIWHLVPSITQNKISAFRIRSKSSQCTLSSFFVCTHAFVHCMRWLVREVTLFQVGWSYSVLLVVVMFQKKGMHCTHSLSLLS